MAVVALSAWVSETVGVPDESARSVHVRGVNVLVTELPALRSAIAALANLASSGRGAAVTEESPEVQAMGFLEMAPQAGNPVPVAEYPKLLEEIDSVIAEHGPR